jgi:hypothetical protein
MVSPVVKTSGVDPAQKHGAVQVKSAACAWLFIAARLALNGYWLDSADPRSTLAL